MESFVQWLSDQLAAALPHISVGPDSAIFHAIVRPAAILNQKLWEIYQEVESYFFLDAFDPEVDAVLLEHIASNFFISKQSGSRARGKVVIRYSEPRDIRINEGATIADTATNKTFVVVDSLYLPGDQLRSKYKDGFYEVEVEVAALLPGSDYNLPAFSQFVALGGFYGAEPVQIYNPASFSGGSDEEGSEQLLRRAISELPRVPGTISIGGLLAWLYDRWGDRVLDARVFPAGSKWVTRDRCQTIVAELTTCPFYYQNYRYWTFAGMTVYSIEVKWFTPPSPNIATFKSAGYIELGSAIDWPTNIKQGDLIYVVTTELVGPYMISKLDEDNKYIYVSEISVPIPGSDTSVQQIYVLGTSAIELPYPISTSAEVDAYSSVCSTDGAVYTITPIILDLSKTLTAQGPDRLWKASDARHCTEDFTPDSVRQGLWSGSYVIIFTQDGWDEVPRTWYFNSRIVASEQEQIQIVNT